jgi:hypothetical protein
MEQVLTKIIFVAILLLLPALGNCITYDFQRQGLKSVPKNISPDTTIIYLGHNQITQIRQANFNGKCPQLSVMYIYYIEISSVEEGSFEGTFLSHINLCRNQLTTFPDFFCC